MEYSCDLASVNKYIHTKDGIALSICNTCQCRDCTNPIEYVEYSVYGVVIKCRIFKRGNTPYCVTACSGYLSEADIKKEESRIVENEENEENYER